MPAVFVATMQADRAAITVFVVPAKISDAQKKLWEQLARESKFNPRD